MKILKMRKVKHLLMLFTVFLTSCALYVPQVSPPVLVEKKEEIQLDIGTNITLGSVALGENAAISYGITDNIQAQVYASYVSSGTSHLQALAGYDFKIKDKKNLKIFGGYFYGTTRIRILGPLFDTAHYSYNGMYQSIFAKLQYNARPRSKGMMSWGGTFTVGYFQPVITERYTYESDYLRIINQEGILYEFYFYSQKNLLDNLAITFYFSNVWIEPLKRYDSNVYDLRSGGLFFNFLGNIGVGFRYTPNKMIEDKSNKYSRGL